MTTDRPPGVEGRGRRVFDGATQPIGPAYPYGSLSPYLNIDPAYIIEVSLITVLDPTYIIETDTQYIFPDGASQGRGRFELAFSTIGGSVLGGAMFGAANGFWTGYRTLLSGEHAIRRTQMVNSVTKRGASTAQTLGVIALMYSVMGVLLSKLRGAEDELNTVTAATCTGLLYKSTAGVRKCVRGGAIGFGLASVYCAYTSKDRLKQMMGLGN